MFYKLMETAFFAMGCFWSPQLLFSKVKGVKDTTVGYMGGSVKNPSYKKVCTGKTGHAETVKIEYNPRIVSYTDLLNLFWKNHNPTQLNRQGLDFGTQYRSIIFYTNKRQEKEALESKKKQKGTVVTEILKAGEFYPAEEYHQDYLKKTNKRNVC